MRTTLILPHARTEVGSPESGQSDLVANWVFSIVDSLGSLGVGLLILLENLIPPIPSEVVLPLAGFRSRTGALNVVAVWVWATAGSVVGALILYGVGRWLGYDRLHRLAGHRWFVLASQRDVDRGCELFSRHGSWIVAGARCVPVLRSVVSLPAGVVGLPLSKFALLTTLGTGVWNALFIWLGWTLAEKWREADSYTAPVSLGVLALVVLGIAVLAWRRHRQRRLAATGG